jgi:hypothetical protein
LQIEGSFDSLHDGMSRDDFISRAAEVAITFNYNESDLRLNKQLDARIKSWNDHNKHKGNIIGLDDILKAAS